MATVKGSTVTLEGIEEFQEKLKQLKTTSPGFEKRLRGAIRKVLGQARAALQKDARGGLQMQSDPRNAYKAVRFAVYKRLFGGQINILQTKRATGNRTSYLPPRKGLPKRGGNRWGRSQRTIDLEGYEGMDRGFILRFLNAGTADRGITSYTDRTGTRHSLGSASSQNIKTRALTGNRGSISARNWFGNASHTELEKAAGTIQEIIDRVIKEEFV